MKSVDSAIRTRASMPQIGLFSFCLFAFFVGDVSVSCRVDSIDAILSRLSQYLVIRIVYHKKEKKSTTKTACKTLLARGFWKSVDVFKNKIGKY